MDSTTDSEFPHSPDSLSLPTEPPDLRNWFSSYQYDTFVLDTYDDAFRSREKNDPSAAGVAEKIRANDDGNLGELREPGEFGSGSEGQTFSEAPESSHSPAFLNEPGNPENWLSSYVSDSGGLDPDDENETAAAIWESQGNGDGFIKEGINREPNFQNSKSKCDETLEKPPSADEFWFFEGNEDSPLNMAPESPCSPAFPNEPVHPENWLSSYVSDSGGLDPEVELEAAAAAVWESGGSEDGSIKEGINRKENYQNPEKKHNGTLEKPPSSDEFIMNEYQFRQGNADSPLTKDPLSQSSSALLSEPPDIRNWFSSYAYESPALDEESNRFVESESQHINDIVINRERNKDEEMKSQCIDMDQGNIDREVKLDALLHCDMPSRNHNQSHLLHSDMSISKAVESFQGYKIQNSDSKSPTELLTPSGDPHTFDKSKAAESDGSNANLFAGSDNGSNISNHGAKNASGFVTRRKKNRITKMNHDENSHFGSSFVAPKCFKSEVRKSCSSPNGSAAKDDSSGNRKVLCERSPNVVQQIEVTGKWKCPQRSKPVMGPPLKQLRLEKWVTRL